MSNRVKNLEKVFERIIDMCKCDEDVAEMFAEELDEKLDFLQSEDAFGTEGQCDPRGDFRNGSWSIMNMVE